MSNANVLITGGAGYIGSHTVLAMQEAGYRVVVIDDLSTGFDWAVPKEVPLFIGDISDGALVSKVLREHNIVGVLHLSGSVVVPESILCPLKYYRNNTSASRSLIEACIAYDVNWFIFSSTAAVYGIPEGVPILENASINPINPYGRSKFMVEQMLRDVAYAHGMKFSILRYFNVAGADAARRPIKCGRHAPHQSGRSSSARPA